METAHICDCCKDKEIIIKYIKCSTYTDSQKKAIKNYQIKNPDKMKEISKSYYHRMKENPEWRAKKFERSRINNKKYYDEKKLLKQNEIINKIEI
jgi:hypothetical protein